MYFIKEEVFTTVLIKASAVDVEKYTESKPQYNTSELIDL